jgi:hypothetical protein
MASSLTSEAAEAAKAEVGSAAAADDDDDVFLSFFTRKGCDQTCHTEQIFRVASTARG